MKKRWLLDKRQRGSVVAAVVLGVLMIALLVGVRLVKQRQELRRGAAGNIPLGIFSPNPISVASGKEVEALYYINKNFTEARNYHISGLDVTIPYNCQYADLEEVRPVTKEAFDKVVLSNKSSCRNGLATVHLVMVRTAGRPRELGKIVWLKFRLKGNPNGPVKIIDANSRAWRIKAVGPEASDTRRNPTYYQGARGADLVWQPPAAGATNTPTPRPTICTNDNQPPKKPEITDFECRWEGDNLKAHIEWLSVKDQCPDSCNGNCAGLDPKNAYHVVVYDPNAPKGKQVKLNQLVGPTTKPLNWITSTLSSAVLPGTTLKVKVGAKDAAGNSNWRDLEDVDAKSCQVPAKETGERNLTLANDYLHRRINLNWSAIPGAVKYQVGVKVYGEDTFTLLTPLATETSYTYQVPTADETHLPVAGEYYFQIQACSDDICSQVIDTIGGNDKPESIVFAPPVVSFGGTAHCDGENKRIVLTWQKPAEGLDHYILDRKLDRKIGEDGNWKLLVRGDGLRTESYTDNDVRSGNTYHYRLKVSYYPEGTGAGHNETQSTAAETTVACGAISVTHPAGSQCETAAQGDLNCNGKVGICDLNHLLRFYGTSGNAMPTPGGGWQSPDIVGSSRNAPPDGKVDIHDLNRLLSNYENGSESCP